MLVFHHHVSRVEIVESVSAICLRAPVLVHTAGGSPGNEARAGMGGVTGWRRGRVAVWPAEILANRRAAFQSSKLRTPPWNPRFTFSHIHLITRASL
jgi:hypothetical protein